MLVKHNYPVAWTFLLLGSFTFLWRYFDTSVVLSEVGSMTSVVEDSISHQEQYRLNEVISRVLSDKGGWLESVRKPLACQLDSLVSSSSRSTQVVLGVSYAILCHYCHDVGGKPRNRERGATRTR